MYNNMFNASKEAERISNISSNLTSYKYNEEALLGGAIRGAFGAAKGAVSGGFKSIGEISKGIDDLKNGKGIIETIGHRAFNSAKHMASGIADGGVKGFNKGYTGKAPAQQAKQVNNNQPKPNNTNTNNQPNNSQPSTPNNNNNN
jgi:hypothetical protein